ncbi:MAG: glycosyltransferase family A protein [Pedobacter sp.]
MEGYQTVLGESGLVKDFLTIAVPTYNGGENLHDLFDSIVNLGLRTEEYEILVVDNCSTDATETVIKNLQRIYPNLRYYLNTHNIGRIENWNKAIELSKGEFLILMNVNDIFLTFDIRKYLQYLSRNEQISMVLADMEFKEDVYPNWKECGVFDLNDYLKKTFLDVNYLEFHSVGVLHQHIFRTASIVKNNIWFDPKLPRTTDRVFVAQLVKASGGSFYYTNNRMVSWRLNSGRYHYNVHINQNTFNFEQLWVNEYEANRELAEIAQIPLKGFLISQLTLASSYTYKDRLATMRDRIVSKKSGRSGMEFPTACIYYQYLLTIARLNGLRLNYYLIKLNGFLIVLKEFLRHHKVIGHKERSLKDMVVPTELELHTT